MTLWCVMISWYQFVLFARINHGFDPYSYEHVRGTVLVLRVQSGFGAHRLSLALWGGVSQLAQT